MKEVLVLVVLFTGSYLSMAQLTKADSGAVITWDKATHDFGEIIQGDKVDHTFHFTNTGNKELLITNVEVTCGCTTPKGWPRDPIAPGNRGELTIAFNSTGKIGKQNKVITITSNSVGSMNQVMFSATVLPKKDSGN
jgi:hypothetical protein